LPPRNLYFPVLPFRAGGKLKFPLCRTCCVNEVLTPCQCNDADRWLIGTWITEEIKVALSKGYKLVKIYEVYHWPESTQYNPETKKGGLFAEYVNQFLKVKTEASGYPAECKSEGEKSRYIQNFYEKEGVMLEAEKIKKNAGLRSIGKALLNSFWGRLGLRDNLQKTKLCREPEEFFEIVDDAENEVSDFQIINDNTVAIVYKYKNDRVPINPTTSIILASFTTAHARLVLYKYLDFLQDRVLYHDTDSIIFISYPNRPDLDPPLGDYLGDMTDELQEGRHIVEFASTGPKSYSYILNDSTQVCKVRGFSLNSRASELINFDTMKSMLLDTEVPIQGFPQLLRSVYTFKKAKISRDKYSSKIYNKPEIKAFRAVYTKRVVQDDLSTLPYGY